MATCHAGMPPTPHSASALLASHAAALANARALHQAVAQANLEGSSKGKHHSQADGEAVGYEEASSEGGEDQGAVLEDEDVECQETQEDEEKDDGVLATHAKQEAERLLPVWQVWSTKL